MPYTDDSVAASTSRMRNAGRPPSCRIVRQDVRRIGEEVAAVSTRASAVCVSSVRYSSSSHFVLRQVK